jgi:hypothetical protein
VLEAAERLVAEYGLKEAGRRIGLALVVGVDDDPYLSAPIVRYSSGRIPWARAVLLERGGHVLVGQERRIRQEVRALFGAPAPNKEESGHRQ